MSHAKARQAIGNVQDLGKQVGAAPSRLGLRREDQGVWDMWGLGLGTVAG
jgi:hypothetical protein